MRGWPLLAAGVRRATERALVAARIARSQAQPFGPAGAPGTNGPMSDVPLPDIDPEQDPNVIEPFREPNIIEPFPNPDPGPEPRPGD